MNRIDTIARLYDVHSTIMSNRAEEFELSSPVVKGRENIVKIYNACVEELCGDSKVTTSHRRQILYVVLAFTCPIALVGGRLSNGLRKTIADIMYVGKNRCVVSADIGCIGFYFQCYKEFSSNVIRMIENVEKMLEKG